MQCDHANPKLLKSYAKRSSVAADRSGHAQVSRMVKTICVRLIDSISDHRERFYLLAINGLFLGRVAGLFWWQTGEHLRKARCVMKKLLVFSLLVLLLPTLAPPQTQTAPDIAFTETMPNGRFWSGLTQDQKRTWLLDIQTVSRLRQHLSMESNRSLREKASTIQPTNSCRRPFLDCNPPASSRLQKSSKEWTASTKIPLKMRQWCWWQPWSRSMWDARPAAPRSRN